MKRKGMIGAVAMRLVMCTLFICLSPVLLYAQEIDSVQIMRYAERYAATQEARSRLRLANEFFAYLRQTDYIDEPIEFPVNSHIDSVDVNVYYYVAEWNYGEGNYQSAVDYCRRATQCMGEVDDVSESDVYALLGAAYFRMGVFDKAAEALNHCYELDKRSADFDRMSSTLNSIASVFVAAGKPHEAEKYILEAMTANGHTDNQARRAVLYGTAAEVYQKMSNPELSLDYARRALDVERQLGDSARIGVRLSQIATAQLGMSRIADAQGSLEEAIPLLLRSGKLHSWGICQNQMGDILASRNQNDEAAACYLEAATLFRKQGDKYNELHAREGLYKVMKSTSPNKAMVHLERANQLRDSIYQHETGEALGKYNAIYFNEILQKEKERAERRSRTVLIVGSIATVLAVVLAAVLIVFTYRRHRQRVGHYEQRISTIQDEFGAVNRKYRNVVADTMQPVVGMTDDDKHFLQQLTDVIEATAEMGSADVGTIAKQMNISIGTLRRRLSQSLSVTPQVYIQQVRMNKARRLLLNYRDMSIADVAYKCAYSQMTNFTRAFSRYYGVKPSELRTLKDAESQLDDASLIASS